MTPSFTSSRNFAERQAGASGLQAEKRGHQTAAQNSDGQSPPVEPANQIKSLAMLVNQHGQRVQQFCGRMTNWHADAADLAQDVFVIAIEQQAAFRGESKVETWLLGIAVRLCRRWTRRQALRKRIFGWLSLERSDVGPDTTTDFETTDQILTGLQSLSSKYREILVLRYMENRDIEDVAAIVQISRQAADQRLTRARQQLATWLEHNS